MEQTTETYTLFECLNHRDNIAELIALGLHKDVDEAGTINHKRFDRRARYKAKCYKAVMKKHAQKVITTGDGFRIDTDASGRAKWKEGTNQRAYSEELRIIDMIEVEVEIFTVDAKLLDQGFEPVKGMIKRNCEFMFTNCPWAEGDDFDLELPIGLEEFADKAEIELSANKNGKGTS